LNDGENPPEREEVDQRVGKPEHSDAASKVQAMTRALVSELALAMTGPALAQTLTCETRGNIRHCFDHHGYLSTEERSGDYVHGHDSQGRVWTTREHDGRTTTWPTR
jgi:hypothetical protein